jgi:site-specific DNA-methyltransferase (adenine-specific)
MARSLVVGDNLEALTRVAAGSATMVYLDPPFNSGRGYEARVGRDAGSAAFSDIWSWDEGTTRSLAALSAHLPRAAAELIRALVQQLGPTSTAAYIVSLSARLGEAHRTLAPDGSLYLHCDPSASHYLKVVLDSIFGPENFRNEIVWRRTHAHSGSRRYGPVHDIIFFYSRSAAYIWNQGYSPYTEDYISTYFRQVDERGAYQSITCTGPGDRRGTLAHYQWRAKWPPPGRHWAWTFEEMTRLEAEGRLVYSRNGVPRLKRYVDDGEGVRLQDVWSDLPPLSAHSRERVGYETQKPVALIERMIAASTRPGDLVIDPYCGTGTLAVAAERLSRSWEVHDVSIMAGSLTLARVRAQTPEADISTRGFPGAEAAARRLLRSDQESYEAWATAMLATQLDRKSHTGSVAVGVRPWSASVVSLVPLETPVRMPSAPRPYPTALVVEGPGSAELTRAVRQHGTDEIGDVPLAALTSPAAAASGKADIDLRLSA